MQAIAPHEHGDRTAPERLAPSPSTVGAFTVATGRYLDFWQSLVLDADRHLFPSSDVEMTVFTDDPARVEDIAKDCLRVSVRVVETGPLGWPEATVMRYDLMSRLGGIERYDVAMHLDADLRIVAEVGPGLDWTGWRSGIAVVRHPSFYRRPRSYAQVARSPRTLASELRKRIQEGGALGSWEHRSDSAAFVPRRSRKAYACGGVWFGQGASVASMTALLAARTRQDSARGVTARWHDESHLNWYAAHHPVSYLDPSYCWDERSAKIIGIPPRIIAVDKGRDWLR